MSIQRQTVKKAMKKTTAKKKVVPLKNRVMFAVARVLGDNMFLASQPKDHANHAINSYLAHGGTEANLKKCVVVEIKTIGKPIVKTTRNITIKK